MRARSIKAYRRVLVQGCAVSQACLHVLGVSRPTVLILLGHMRSGSTLLLHLLLTSPEIAALGERNAVYTSRTDFAQLAIAARFARRSLFGRIRYVADQVNHTHLTPVPALLADSQVRLLFLLRRPEASLSSLLELSRRHYRSSWSVTRAVDYYVTRLEDLMKLAESVPASHAALICYETLIEYPEITLEALRRFLGLSHALSRRYDIHPFTRTRGDPGSTIAAGTIVRNETVTDSRLSDAELLRARRAYQRCAAALARFALDSGAHQGEHSQPAVG